MMMIGIFGHVCAHGRLMGRATSKGNEAESNMKDPSDIRTRVVAICGPTLYQLDHGGALTNVLKQAFNSLEHYSSNNDL